MRVVQRLPGKTDLIFDRDRTGGAHGGALTAGNALRFAQRFSAGGGDVQIRTAPCKLQVVDALDLLAYAHAVSAENAFVHVDVD